MIVGINRNEGMFSVPERPQEFDNMYFKGVDKQRLYCFIHIQKLEDIAYLHLEVILFGASILKAMKRDLEQLRKELRGCGIKRIVGSHCSKGSDKWGRFLNLVGFPLMQDVDELLGEGAKMTYMEI